MIKIKQVDYFAILQ